MQDEQTNTVSVGWGSGYIVTSDKTSRIVGRLMQVIETMGLPEKQETAVKDQIKSIVYPEINDYLFYIDSNGVSKVYVVNSESKAAVVGGTY